MFGRGYENCAGFGVLGGVIFKLDSAFCGNEAIDREWNITTGLFELVWQPYC
jgi:hypothetical protein